METVVELRFHSTLTLRTESPVEAVLIFYNSQPASACRMGVAHAPLRLSDLFLSNQRIKLQDFQDLQLLTYNYLACLTSAEAGKCTGDV